MEWESWVGTDEGVWRVEAEHIPTKSCSGVVRLHLELGKGAVDFKMSTFYQPIPYISTSSNHQGLVHVNDNFFVLFSKFCAL